MFQPIVPPLARRATGQPVATAEPCALQRFPDLPLGRYRLEWEALQAVDDSQYLGSAWRGVFGHALKRQVCVTRASQCKGCEYLHSCAYTYLFETPGEAPSSEVPTSGAKPSSATAAAAPHPLILRVETPACSPGALYRLGIVLVGRAVKLLPHAVRAFEEAARQGIGPRELRFRLRGVSQENPTGGGQWLPILQQGRLTPLPAAAPPIPPRPSHARIALLTPLRLRSQGAYVREEGALGDFAASLLRRYLLMLRYHGDADVAEDLSGLFQAARNWKPFSAELRWHDWARYSNRQQTHMLMGGLLGEFAVSLDAFPEIWPSLWIGQFLHAGKAASMGLGAYRIEALPSPAGSSQPCEPYTTGSVAVQSGGGPNP